MYVHLLVLVSYTINVLLIVVFNCSYIHVGTLYENLTASIFYK